jgi:hypothetical protein
VNVHTGGVFGNSKQGIYEAILKAHKKWANHPASQLEKVSIVLFSDRDFMTSFPSILKQQNVPFRFVSVPSPPHYTRRNSTDTRLTLASCALGGPTTCTAAP